LKSDITTDALQNPEQFFYSKLKIERNIFSAIQTSIRKTTKNKEFTVKDIRGEANRLQLLTSDYAYQFMAAIPASPAYCAQGAKKARAMIRQFDFPVGFLTLSPNNQNAPELIIQMLKNNQRNDENPKEYTVLDVLEFPPAEIDKLIRDDPVLYEQYHHNRIEEMLKWLQSPLGPFGKYFVCDFIRRREYQMRGFPHDHIILWLKNIPKLDKMTGSNFGQIEEIIDELITCQYHKLHKHNCTETCTKGRYDKTKCRFRFPKFVMPRTRMLQKMASKTKQMEEDLAKIQKLMHIYRATEEVQSFEDMLERLEMTYVDYENAIRLTIEDFCEVFYKRASNEVNVNPHNQHITDVWQANHDFQFVIDPYAIIAYLLEYCFKSDAGMLEALKEVTREALEGNKSMKDTLRLIGSKFNNSLTVSAPQAAGEVLGNPIIETSRTHFFINTNLPNKRFVIRKSEKELEMMNDNDKDYAHEEFLTQYSSRPDDLEHVCLADFVAKYNKKANKSYRTLDSDDSNDENCAKVPGKLHYDLRTKDRCVRWCSFKIDKDPYNFYREQVMLFVPWRNEQKELLEVDCKKLYDTNLDTILEKFLYFNKVLDETFDEY
jgi:Helitron helicase-like domain at N-terminus